MTVHGETARYKIRRATLADEPLLDRFFGSERAGALGESGMHVEAEGFELSQMLAAQKAGWVEIWLAEETAQGEAHALLLFQRLGFPGVWTFSAVTSGAAPQGRGVATETIAAAIDKLFEDETVVRLMGYVAVTAPGPARVCEKLGFRFEGRARSLITLGSGERVDAWLVGLLAADWPACRSTIGSDPGSVNKP